MAEYIHDSYKFTIQSPYTTEPTTQIKAQLHCHTTNSDGVDSPMVLAQAYKNAGYGGLAITDHDYITTGVEIDGLIYIPSIEEIGGAYHAHVVAYDVQSQTTQTSFPAVIKHHRENGVATSVAHPMVNGNTPIIPGLHALQTTDYFNFIEVYNGLAADDENSWDDLLSKGRRIYGLATDDCHNISSIYFNRGWVVVNTTENTKDGLLSALRRGDFYASNGNDITVTVVEKSITATSSVLSNISFIGKDGRVLCSKNNVLTATYSIVGNEQYVRCVSQSVATGKKAWGQPIFVDIQNDDSSMREALKSAVTGIYKQPLVNGDFDIWQNGHSFVFNNANATGYFADQWKVTGNMQSSRVDRIDVTTPIARGDMGRYCARMTVVNRGTGSTMGIYQALLSSDSILFRGKTVAVGVWLRKNETFTSGSVSVYIYASTGTDEPAAETGRQIIDVITIPCSDLHNSIFKLFEAPVDINWNRNQIAVMIRMNGETIPDGSYIDIKRVQICMGDKILPYERKSVRDELFACQAFFQKSYNVDTPPATSTKIGSFRRHTHHLSTISLYDKDIRFVRSMVKIPTVTIYGTTGVPNTVRCITDNTDRAVYADSNYTSENGTVIVADGNTLTPNALNEFHYVADARMY